jgi:AraC family transcriptional regulator, transcriptional activator of pobA
MPKALHRSTVVQLAIAYIEKNYAHGISLADVAHALNYSPCHLTSLVRKETGRPVTAWIIERRLREARERLLATDDPVAAVAEAVGFRDVTYFVRRFARSSGTTPSQWRARFLERRQAIPTCPTCGTCLSNEAAG